MNKQSNSYTIIYIIVLVVVVGAALAFTAMGLKDRQQQNADADRMRQILAAVHITPSADGVTADFERYISGQTVVDSKGAVIGSDAFAVDIAAQVKLPVDERKLPVFICTLADGDVKYILPMYGAGLWGPIWGYVALDSDAATIYGAYFAHQGETPGLGAEIEKPAFSDQFDGKTLWKEGRFMPVAVVKKGQPSPSGEDYVDGISGGTITSKGVSAMLSDCLRPYESYLLTLRSK
ncbi:MAG: NADH:ubiquinone reductase (Na(+)-transporting) subunit C [Muribaculaceae bacterium]|nr:NADH:ubiquinone reductase (Na(+)-transporting) subunit C [Muribaculaceae bacterium]MDE6332857.1 NADH:ubiquinone reductase (Na(+)-transporting) subunit C [Muribaculaceae bacterium]